jgi:hypothetical protein
VRSTLVAAMMLIVTPAFAAPDDLVTRPLVLPAGTVDLRLTAEINVQPKLVGQPLSFAPDAWWGILPRWTIGVIHSNASIDLFEAGATFCVQQSNLVTSTCHRLYRGSGLDVRFSALAGPLAIAPRLRLLIRDLDPIKPATTLGALLRWSHGRFAITSDPYLRLPLANHDLGNRAALVVPIWFAVQPAHGWELAVHTGYNADVVVLREDGHIPLSLGVTRRVTGDLDLRVEAGWSRLLGPQHDVARGALMIGAGWHR